MTGDIERIVAKLGAYWAGMFREVFLVWGARREDVMGSGAYAPTFQIKTNRAVFVSITLTTSAWVVFGQAEGAAVGEGELMLAGMHRRLVPPTADRVSILAFDPNAPGVCSIIRHPMGLHASW